MWSLTRNTIFVFIYFNIGFILADHECVDYGEKFNAQPADVPLPAYINKTENNDTEKFWFILKNITENFTLTLYVDPFKKDPNDCLKIPDTAANLYENYKRPEITKELSGKYDAPMAPTGCYYAKLTNKNEQNFIVPLTYFIGSTKFYHWNPKCYKDSIQPPTENTGRKFSIKLGVPLRCLNVEMKLFEVEKSVDEETLSEVSRGIIQPIGNCLFGYTNYSCASTKTGFKITREYSNSTEDEYWIANIEWTRLKEEGAHYFSLFSMKNDICNFDYRDVMTWKPSNTLRLINHGYDNTTNISSDKQDPSLYRSTVYHSLFIISGLLVIMTIIFCVWMYIKLYNNRGTNVSSPDQQPEERLYIDKILLIYMQSTSNFMKKMQVFKNELKKRCKHEVYDIYSTNEYSATATLRPHSWIERIMKYGCKVVWIDTPQLRSYLNDRSKLNSEEKNNHIEMDFRDSAIKYALELTKTSFKDLDNQYMYHFVVRLNGLGFTDEADDPLSSITPHRRFCIPKHFDMLCADLAK